MDTAEKQKTLSTFSNLANLVAVEFQLTSLVKQILDREFA